MDGDGNLSAQPGQQVEVSGLVCENKYANINEVLSFDDNALIDCDGMFLL